MKSPKFIAKIFRDIADKIEAETCEVDAEELSFLVDKFMHIKLNIEETCKELHTSRATLSRMIADGRVPPPKKTPGGDKYWWKDELLAHVDDYNKKYNLDKLNNRITRL